MKLYLVRHGQTDWNVQMLAQGRTDIPLNSTGIAQAEALRDRVKDYKFDICYCSPLVRAAKTAEIVVDGRCKIVPDKLLVERCFGKYEGTARDGIEFKKSKANFADRYCGGESMLQLAQRIYNLLDEVKEKSDDKTYLLVAHNGIARMVNSYFCEMTNEEYASFGIKNAQVVKYDFE